MKRYFKLVIVLFAFLFVTACNSKSATLDTITVSSINNDSVSLSNENEEILKANVMIFNNNYNSLWGFKYKENNTYGSGVIYKCDNSYYYVLTNNHVISYDYKYNNHEIFVEDYYGNRYVGEVIYSDINYDLAVVRFENKAILKILEINEDEVEVRESIKSIGNPQLVKNVINNGMVNCFSYVTLNNSKSKVDFEVIVHSAAIYGGSSGGAIVDSDNKIVGLTFAGVFDKKGNFITGYAIPSSKIIEFLSK